MGNGPSDKKVERRYKRADKKLKKAHAKSPKAGDRAEKKFGYNFKEAERAGLGPDETGHWPSRNPDTGEILKGRRHPTIGRTKAAEKRLGFKMKKKKGVYFSQPKAEGGTVSQSKAKKIMADGKVKGKKLSTAQKGFFGAIAGGTAGKRKKMAGGGRMKYQDGGKVKKAEAPEVKMTKEDKALGQKKIAELDRPITQRKKDIAGGKRLIKRLDSPYKEEEFHQTFIAPKKKLADGGEIKKAPTPAGTLTEAEKRMGKKRIAKLDAPARAAAGTKAIETLKRIPSATPGIKRLREQGRTEEQIKTLLGGKKALAEGGKVGKKTKAPKFSKREKAREKMNKKNFGTKNPTF